MNRNSQFLLSKKRGHFLQAPSPLFTDILGSKQFLEQWIALEHNAPQMRQLSTRLKLINSSYLLKILYLDL